MFIDQAYTDDEPYTHEELAWLEGHERQDAAFDLERTPYCDLCEIEGHSFRTCPARDDYPEDEAEELSCSCYPYAYSVLFRPEEMVDVDCPLHGTRR